MPEPKIQPPRDPILRAIWKINQAEDLTPTEKLACLVLWRYLGKDRKPLGARLLGSLLNVSSGAARNIFASLQKKGYLISDGQFQPGVRRRAKRQLTNKISLPTNKKRHQIVTQKKGEASSDRDATGN